MSGFKTEGTMEPALALQKLSEEKSLGLSFGANEWEELTPEQRMRRCQIMAEQAHALAKAAPTEIAQSYLKIANEWLELAAEMQQISAGRTQ